MATTPAPPEAATPPPPSRPSPPPPGAPPTRAATQAPEQSPTPPPPFFHTLLATAADPHADDDARLAAATALALALAAAPPADPATLDAVVDALASLACDEFAGVAAAACSAAAAASHWLPAHSATHLAAALARRAGVHPRRAVRCAAVSAAAALAAGCRRGDAAVAAHVVPALAARAADATPAVRAAALAAAGELARASPWTGQLVVGALLAGATDDDDTVAAAAAAALWEATAPPQTRPRCPRCAQQLGWPTNHASAPSCCPARGRWWPLPRPTRRAPRLGVCASPARVLWGLVAAVGDGLDEANIATIIHTLALQLADGGDAAWCAVVSAQALAASAPPPAWLPPVLQLEEGDTKLTLLSSLLFGCAAGSHRLDGGAASAVAAAVAAAAAATPSPAAIHQAVTLTTRAASPPLSDTACRDLWRAALSVSGDDDGAPACPPPALVTASGAADAAAFTAAHAPSLLESATADLAAGNGARSLGVLLPCLDATTLATALPSLLTALAPTFAGDDAVLQARLLHALTVMAATPAGATALRGGAAPQLTSTILAPALAQRRRGWRWRWRQAGGCRPGGVRGWWCGGRRGLLCPARPRARRVRARRQRATAASACCSGRPGRCGARQAACDTSPRCRRCHSRPDRRVGVLGLERARRCGRCARGRRAARARAGALQSGGRPGASRGRCGGA